MRKQELLRFRKQKATPSMMRSAEQDELQDRYGYHYFDCRGYRIGMYLRCLLERDVLKVSFFLTEPMKAGGKLPAFELYLDKKNMCFITYDCIEKKWRNAKLDMLPWPRYIQYSVNKWISAEDHTMIKNYLETKQGGYAGLVEFQLQVRAEELKQRHRRETDPWDLDLEQTRPIPKDWDHWVHKVGITRNFIFYHYDRKGAKTGYCSYCEKEVPIKEPRHHKEGVCPKCRHKITFKAIGRMGSFNTPSENMYLIQPCDTGFMIRQFVGNKCYYRGDYKNPHYSCWEVRRSIFNQKAQPVSAYYWGVYKQTHSRWVKSGICGTHGRYYWECGMHYGKSLAPLFKTALRDTGYAYFLQKNKQTDPEYYLAYYNRVPQLEKLVKADLNVLVQECFSKCDDYQKFFAGRQETELIKAMGIDAPRLKRLRESKMGLQYLYWLRYEKEHNMVPNDELLMWFIGKNIAPNAVDFIDDRMSLLQIRNYLERQSKENRESIHWVLRTWADYLSMAKRLNLDTTDSIIYRVRKLKQRHQELVERCNELSDELFAEEMLQTFPNINEVCRSIQDLYSYTGRSYMVVVPTDIMDVIREGKALHHCVGKQERYYDRISRRESYVLFLRRRKDPDKPYYTLEIEPDGTVRQKRTMFDRQEKDIDKAKKFLREWQGVVASRLTGVERKLAIRSKALRNQEFEELKQQNKFVYIKNEGSRSLLQLLLDDLMENTEAVAEPVLAAAA